MSDWIIRHNYKYEAVEFVKETAAMIFYIDRSWGKAKETRSGKDAFLLWRGSEETARLLARNINSAQAERDRRKVSANLWFLKRRAEILAQGTEAGTATTAQTGVVHDGPVATPCAPEQAA